MGVRMTKHVLPSTDTESELASIARMLTHIRDSARALDAQAVEYCVEMALHAVADEIRHRHEFVITGAGLDTSTRRLQ
ncbi:hypothetical protein [Ensifer aridi]|uniref:hypothetical protein n=1 Tax=Ensifer aridi TaxID=1708715 RepID=UPI00047D0C90|nr:hypothetical protein [Ensifer aridi]